MDQEIAAARVEKRIPDKANIPYGPHERNVLDFWQAKSDRPTPLIVYIHGGGFRKGDKSGLRPSLLNACLDEGFSFAAINYRLSHQASFPAFMHDGGRAVQFLRSRGSDWNIDPQFVAATGESAGGGISLWLGFHDDLADPSSDDPVLRQSTRLTCMGVQNTQCSYDPRFYKKIGLAPAAEHPALPSMYGLTWQEFDKTPPYKLFEDAAPITWLSAGDPPVFIFFSQPNEPLPSDAVARRLDPEEAGKLPKVDPMAGKAIHHPKLGEILKEKLDELDIECVMHAGTRERVAQIDQEMVQFFSRQFAVKK